MNAMRWIGAQLLDQQSNDANGPKIAPGKCALTDRLPLQRKATAGAPVPAAAMDAAAASAAGEREAGSEAATDPFSLHLPSAGQGSPLPDDVRARMETSFSTSFASVRVSESAAAEELGAEAFASGENITFAPGRMSFGSQSGLELLGHELAHVVQQREGRVSVPQGKGGSINADPGLEAEADRAGALAAAGLPVGSGSWSAAAVAPAASAGPLQLKGNRAARNKRRRKQERQRRGREYVERRGSGRQEIQGNGTHEDIVGEPPWPPMQGQPGEDGLHEDGSLSTSNPFSALQDPEAEGVEQWREAQREQRQEASRKNREAQLRRDEEARRLQKEAEAQERAEREREIAERLKQLEEEQRLLEEERAKLEEQRRREEKAQREEEARRLEEERQKEQARLEKEEEERRRREEQERLRREEEEKRHREEEAARLREEERRKKLHIIPAGAILTSTVITSSQGFVPKGTVLKTELEVPKEKNVSFLEGSEHQALKHTFQTLCFLAQQSPVYCSQQIDVLLTPLKILSYVPIANATECDMLMNCMSPQTLLQCLSPSTAPYLVPHLQNPHVLSFCVQQQMTFILPHCNAAPVKNLCQSVDSSVLVAILPQLRDAVVRELLQWWPEEVAPLLNDAQTIFCMANGCKELLVSNAIPAKNRSFNEKLRARGLSCCQLLRCTGKVLDAENLQAREDELKTNKKLPANVQELELLLELALPGDVVCIQVGLLKGRKLKVLLANFNLAKLAEAVEDDYSYGGDGVAWRATGPTLMQAKGNSSAQPLVSTDWTTSEGEMERNTVPFCSQLIKAARQLAGLIAWGDDWGQEQPPPNSQKIVCIKMSGARCPHDLNPYLRAARDTLAGSVNKSTGYGMNRLGEAWTHVHEIWIDWQDGARTVLLSNGDGTYRVT